MCQAIWTMIYFLLAGFFIPSLVVADDVNDILMLNNKECNNYGDQMQCTGVIADYCCFAAMPFCWVALYDSSGAIASLTAWSNTNSCPVGSGSASSSCTDGYCSCLDANTDGSKTAACSALWSATSSEQPPHRVEARSPGSNDSTCRPADTLKYTDGTTGKQRVINNITHENFEEVMGFYNGQNFAELAMIAVPL